MAKRTKVAKVPQVSQVSHARKWIIWVGGGIILLISVVNLSLWIRNEIAKSQRVPVEQEIKQWEEIVGKTPTYRDGYLKLATLYWKLHEDKKAKEALNRAEEIDPNYEGTQDLREQLGY